MTETLGSLAQLFSDGLALHRAGRLDEAALHYRNVLAGAPDHVDALVNWGAIHLLQGRPGPAVDLLNRALARDPAHVSALINRGGALQALRRYDAALADYDAAIAGASDNPLAHDNRGLLLALLKRPEEALTEHERAAALNPDFAAAHLHRGDALAALKRYGEALESYDRALVLDPSNPDIHNNRGVALFDCGRAEDALACHEAARRLRPDYADAICNHGVTLQELGRYEEALVCYDAALRLRPDDVRAAFNKAHLKLLLGDYREGWALHETRWLGETSRPRFPRREPLWLGAEDIAGKTVLLQAEQGFGDAVQFCRYAPLVARMGATVIIEVQKEIARLVSTLEPAVAVYERGRKLPTFDYACPFMSLPFALKTTLATIPAAAPYLHADPDLQTRWRERLGTRARRRVGVVWSGYAGHNQDRNRSMPVAALGPLLGLDADFHCLQKDITPGDRDWLAADGRMHLHGTDAFADFADTAALIANLDLVISVDTAVAHVAGAIGKPVWVLLSHVPDFRWLTARIDSPWYPTARLFRQPQRGDWTAVVAAVIEALRALP